MLKNLLNTVLRSLYRQKAYSIVNIFGLATGVTCTLLILIWVEYETTFDKFHKDIDQIHVVYENQRYADGDVFSVYSTPAPLAEKLKDEFPGILYSSRMATTWGQLSITTNGKKMVENGGKVVDPDFFKIFSFPIVRGDEQNPLPNSNSIILTERLAEKFFGDIEPVGQTVEINSRSQYQVTAVVKNPPANSSITFDFFLPFYFFEEFRDYDLTDWEANSFYTFVKLKKETNETDFVNRIKNLIAQQVPDTNIDLGLQAFERYHLHSIALGETGPIWYVRIFVLVAVLILLTACFNYMNLATARSERRAKEVAVRKIVGAQRHGLVSLFLGESVLFTIIALGIAIVLTELLLPTFSDLTNRTLSLYIGNLKFVATIVGVVLLTGILSGSYPALFLSSFRPVQIVRGHTGRDSAALRKILVLIQYTISIALLIFTGIIYQQLKFLKKSDIGYNKQNIVYLEVANDFNKHYTGLKNELLKIPGVQWATAANQMPINFSSSTWDVNWAEKSSGSEDVLFQLSFVDFDFIETFEMDVIQGRGFSREFGEDSLKFIINQSAARKMGMAQTIGEELNIWGYTGEVIGIVKDFNFNSLQVGIDPLIMMRTPGAFRYIGIRIGEDHQPILNNIRKAWDKIIPNTPFAYRFLEDDFIYLYQAESRMGKLFISFTIIAFIISCLGLFGLVSFVTEQKTKEMALRKVFGAEIDNISQLLAKDFFKWFLLSNAIAWLIAYFSMEWWLNGFAYRVNIGIGIFIVAGIFSFLVAFVTIYKQISNLAKITPSKILKYE